MTTWNANSRCKTPFPLGNRTFLSILGWIRRYLFELPNSEALSNLPISLKQQKSKVTVWGIGTRLVTAYDNPSLGLVYKLSAIKENKSWIKKIKLSEQKIKINNPGILQVHRYINDGKYDGDMIVDELIKNPNSIMIHPHDSTKVKRFSKNIKHIKLLVRIFRNGKPVYKNPSILKIKKLLSSELDKIDNSIKRLHNPHLYKVGLEKKLYHEKNDMILNLRKL